MNGQSVFEEIGEYMEKYAKMEELLKDHENVEIAITILEKQGWDIR